MVAKSAKTRPILEFYYQFSLVSVGAKCLLKRNPLTSFHFDIIVCKNSRVRIPPLHALEAQDEVLSILDHPVQVWHLVDAAKSVKRLMRHPVRALQQEFFLLSMDRGKVEIYIVFSCYKLKCTVEIFVSPWEFQQATLWERQEEKESSNHSDKR